MSDYESEREALLASYDEAVAPLRREITTLGEHLKEDVIALMQKHGIENEAVRLLKAGHVITWGNHYDQFDYNLDGHYIDPKSPLIASIEEAENWGLIEDDEARMESRRDGETYYYRLPETAKAQS